MGNQGGRLSRVVPVKDDDEQARRRSCRKEAEAEKAVAEKKTNKDGKYCLVVLGNPGAGKSTVLNSLIGQAQFLSGFSPGRGLTTKVDCHEHKGVVYVDTPGLADTKFRQMAAAAITEALARESEYRILFMVTIEGWNFRPQDKATVELVLEAIEGVDLTDKYAVVANKVAKDEAAERVRRMANVFFKGIVPTRHVTWLTETEMEEDDQLLKLPESFLSFIDQVPKVFIKKECVAQVKWNKFEERRLMYVKEIAELEATQRDLRRQLQDLSSKGDGAGKTADQCAEQAEADVPGQKDMSGLETSRRELTKGDELVILEEMKVGTTVLKSGSHGKVVGWDSKSEFLELQCDGLETAAKIPHDLLNNFCLVADVGSLRRNKVKELANRGLTLESLLDFYVKLSQGDLPMTDFDPMKSTTADVVSKAIIPETKSCAKSYAEVAHPGGKLAMRMVTHNWGNVFAHLIAAIVADALDMPHFSEILDDLKPSEIQGLIVHLRKLKRLSIVYWVCAFSVNQHRSICKKRLGCTCTSTNINNDSPLCEMDKFDSMMAFLFNNKHSDTLQGDTAPRHVVAVDLKHALFTRAWVVAELVIALCMDAEPEQKYRVYDESSLKRCLDGTGRKGIDTRNCEASHPADKKLVLKKTEEQMKKCGYDWTDLHAKLNDRVFERLKETHAEVDKSRFLHVLCIGNAGVGKSTILNKMIDKPLFPVGAGGEPQPALCEHVHNNTVFMEALGLADLELREKTAEAITKALKKEGRYKIFFVVTLESGRVRPEDTEMIHRVLQAAPGIGSEYSVIINKILLKEARDLANPKTLKAIRSELFVALDPPLEPTDDVSWVEKNGKLPRGLLRDASELVLGRGMVRNVDAQTDEQKAEKVAAMKKQLEEDTAILKERLAKELAASRGEHKVDHAHPAKEHQVLPYDDKLTETPQIAVQFGSKVHVTMDDTKVHIPLELVVRPPIALQGRVRAAVRTRDGTAKVYEDYEPLDEMVEFCPGEVEKLITVNIIDDEGTENDDEFFVDIINVKYSGNDDVDIHLGEVCATKVLMLDDDGPGCVMFETEVMHVQEQAEDIQVEVRVKRKGGFGKGPWCRYKTEDDTAIAGRDYEGASGELHFDRGQVYQKIPITIKARGRYDAVDHFRVILHENMNGMRFDEMTDGGSECCICTIYIDPSKQERQAADPVVVDGGDGDEGEESMLSTD